MEKNSDVNEYRMKALRRARQKSLAVEEGSRSP